MLQATKYAANWLMTHTDKEIPTKLIRSITDKQVKFSKLNRGAKINPDKLYENVLKELMRRGAAVTTCDAEQFDKAVEKCRKNLQAELMEDLNDDVSTSEFIADTPIETQGIGHLFHTWVYDVCDAAREKKIKQIKFTATF